MAAVPSELDMQAHIARLPPTAQHPTLPHGSPTKKLWEESVSQSSRAQFHNPLNVTSPRQTVESELRMLSPTFPVPSLGNDPSPSGDINRENMLLLGHKAIDLNLSRNFRRQLENEKRVDEQLERTRRYMGTDDRFQQSSQTSIPDWKQSIIDRKMRAAALARVEEEARIRTREASLNPSTEIVPEAPRPQNFRADTRELDKLDVFARKLDRADHVGSLPYTQTHYDPKEDPYKMEIKQFLPNPALGYCVSSPPPQSTSTDVFAAPGATASDISSPQEQQQRWVVLSEREASPQRDASSILEIPMPARVNHSNKSAHEEFAARGPIVESWKESSKPDVNKLEPLRRNDTPHEALLKSIQNPKHLKAVENPEPTASATPLGHVVVTEKSNEVIDLQEELKKSQAARRYLEEKVSNYETTLATLLSRVALLEHNAGIR